jgi:hypothetical protein
MCTHVHAYLTIGFRWERVLGEDVKDLVFMDMCYVPILNENVKECEIFIKL